MRIERFFNILALVCICFVLLFFIVLTIDLNRTKHDKAPIFVVETTTFEDGSKRYSGLLYSVYFFPDADLEDLPSYHLTPWFTDVNHVKMIHYGIPLDE